MRRIGVIADELIESLCAARDNADDQDAKRIWSQKIAEVARRKEYENCNEYISTFPMMHTPSFGTCATKKSGTCHRRYSF